MGENGVGSLIEKHRKIHDIHPHEYDLEKVDWLNLEFVIILMTFIGHGLRPKASVSELSVWNFGLWQDTKRIKAKL